MADEQLTQEDVATLEAQAQAPEAPQRGQVDTPPEVQEFNAVDEPDVSDPMGFEKAHHHDEALGLDTEEKSPADPAPEKADPPAEEKPAEPAPEPEPEPEKTEEKVEAEPETAELDATLVRRAAQLGLTDQQIENFGTDDALESAITLFDARLLAGLPQDQQPLQPQAVQPVQTQQQQPEPVPQPQAEPDIPQEFKFTPKLDPEEVSPEIVDQFNAMSEHYAGLFNKFAAAFGGTKEQLDGLMGDRVAARIAEFDGLIQNLSEEYHADDVFGTGSEADLNPRSEAYQNRAKVFDLWNRALPQAYSQNKLPVPSGPMLLRFAMNQGLNGKTVKVERRRTEKAITERRKKTTHRPAQREGARQTRPQTEDEFVEELYENARSIVRKKGKTPTTQATKDELLGLE